MDVPPAETDGSIAAFVPLLASDDPISVSEQHWRCGETPFIVRTSPGLAALHHAGRVFALPAVPSASGARFASTDVEFWNKADQATIRIEEQRFDDCVVVPEEAG
jgi:membrane-bound inhibitor of C-type lysozyme